MSRVGIFLVSTPKHVEAVEMILWSNTVALLPTSDTTDQLGGGEWVRPGLTCIITCMFSLFHASSSSRSFPEINHLAARNPKEAEE